MAGNVLTKKIVLREFAYFDRQKVEDFLSSIEDGLAREKTEISRKMGGEAKGEVSVGIAKFGAGVERKGSELQEMKAATDASLFQRLYTYLKNEKLIRDIDSINAKEWTQIEKGEITELTGGIELSLMENLIDILATFMPLMGTQVIDEKARSGLKLLQMLGKLSSEKGFNIKITPRVESKFRLVAHLPAKYIRVGSKQELTGDYRILCRVQKRLKPNETFNLFSFFPGIRMPKNALEQLIKTFPIDLAMFLGKPIQIEDFRVSYPAMIVTPIAIYR